MRCRCLNRATICGRNGTAFGRIRLSSVYGGLMAAAFFTELFGDYERSDQLRNTAAGIKQGILTHLWDEESGPFRARA